MYKLFWYDIAINLTNVQRAELLDTLVEQRRELSEKIRDDPEPNNPACHLPSRLLACFLNEPHEAVAPDRLFDWLGVAALDFEDFDPSGLYEDLVGLHTGNIRDWLSEHPKIQKAIIAMCVERCRGKQPFDSFNICVCRKHRRLFGATWPPDFGSWCLEQAIHATDDHAATWYIHEVADALHNHQHDEGLTREIVDARLANRPSLEQAFRGRLSQREESKNREKTLKEEVEKKTDQEQQKFRDLVKENKEALSEKRCRPSLLNHLARAYFGEPIDIYVDGDKPRDRLHNLLGGDMDWVETVLTALRDSVNRSDVPDEAEIIRLSTNNLIHFLEFPFLAGLEELSKPDKKAPLNERQMRQAIASHYNCGALRYYSGKKPHWYGRLLAHHPEVVSDVLIEFVRSQLRNRRERFPEVHMLASSNEHKEVARLASLTLLELFPVRCTSPQLGLLNALLIAAGLHGEREAFEKLIEHKLSLRSMNIAQRVYWLAAGFLASPVSYRETIETFVSGHEQRIRHLAKCLTTPPASLLGDLGVQDLELLIRLTGSSYRPYSDSSPSEGFSTDWAQRTTSALVTTLINRLASLPSRYATEAIDSLRSDNALRPWHAYLIRATYQQNVIRREASFRHQEVGQVLEVLDNQNPANAADLAALTTDILSDMSRQIRDGNTSDWRQYWNMDSSNKPDTPKHEDLCRDALLSDLQREMKPLDIDAQPESHYADDTRADIRVTYGDFNVPVEIKKSTHRDLWNAIRKQLISRYTRDPGTKGYGIYLVFWFGAKDCPMSPSGKRPTIAHELQEQLREMLSADEQRKISVCVIDVARREKSTWN